MKTIVIAALAAAFAVSTAASANVWHNNRHDIIRKGGQKRSDAEFQADVAAKLPSMTIRL